MQSGQFIPGVGRLAVDRFDFQNHITGSDATLKHIASSINLDIPINIGNINRTNVQDSIQALSDAVFAAAGQPDSSSTVKGILKLTNDFGGTAENPLVLKIQGTPISVSGVSSTTGNGYVLTWIASSGTWLPQPINGSFIAGGDLYGSNNSQQVSSLSGLSNIVSVNASNILFNSSITSAKISQSSIFGNASNLTISAQSSVSGIGGNIIISGGAGVNYGANGVILQSGNTSSNMLQIIELASNRRIVGLFGEVSTSSVPTGDMMLFINNSPVIPSSATNNGAALFANNGSLWVNQSDGNQFQIGSIPNPSIWGSTSQQQTITQRFYTTTNTPYKYDTSNIPQNTAIRVDVIMLVVSGSDCAQYNLSSGFFKSTSLSPLTIGTTYSDQKNTSGASSWSSPVIYNAALNSDPETSVIGPIIYIKSDVSNSKCLMLIQIVFCGT